MSERCHTAHVLSERVYRPTWKGFTMPNRSLQQLLKLPVITSAAILALSARADLRERAADDRRGGEHDDRGGHDDRQEHKRLLRLATGQYITPTFMDGAVQPYLNPGLTG